MDEILAMTLFGYPLLHVVGAAVGVVVVFIVLKAVFRGNQASSHTTTATCFNCGWSGTVSAYSRTCPKCNSKM